MASGGFELKVDPSQYSVGAQRLRKVAPRLFDKMFVAWLMAGSSKLKLDSMRNSSEIKGATGQYARGFRISPVQGVEGKRWQLMFNVMNYSLVIEYGGNWTTKQPPPGVLDEWVRRVLAPETEEEVRGIAFAIGRNLKTKGSSKQGAHNKRVMTRTLEQDEQKLFNLFKNMLNRAINQYERGDI